MLESGMAALRDGDRLKLDGPAGDETLTFFVTAFGLAAGVRDAGHIGLESPWLPGLFE
ncbi:MAG: hypothetical protein ACKVQU_37500 [Burkholderiales bacterium]